MPDARTLEAAALDAAYAVRHLDAEIDLLGHENAELGPLLRKRREADELAHALLHRLRELRKVRRG